MESILSQQLNVLLSMTLLVHSAMAICLFAFARSSNRNTLLWTLAGFVGGLLALITYIVLSIRDYSQPETSRTYVFRGDDTELEAHLLNQTDMRGEKDEAIEGLISEGYLEKAREQAREKMQTSFNYGDGMREHIYRSYLKRIDLLSQHTPSRL
jgi:hypothetical protein